MNLLFERGQQFLHTHDAKASLILIACVRRSASVQRGAVLITVITAGVRRATYWDSVRPWRCTSALHGSVHLSSRILSDKPAVELELRSVFSLADDRL